MSICTIFVDEFGFCYAIFFYKLLQSRTLFYQLAVFDVW